MMCYWRSADVDEVGPELIICTAPQAHSIRVEGGCLGGSVVSVLDCGLTGSPWLD